MAAPKKTHGASSFATILVTGPVCFFLGIIFAQFPYDFPLLWTKAPVTPEYIDQITTHINFILESPPLIGRLLNIVMVVGLLGFLIKLFNPTEANVLFDGASLVLYLIGIGIYLTNIMKGLRSVKADIWSKPGWDTDDGPGLILGKEDSLKVLSASNTILALVLAGVLVLQAGQWYAESAESKEQEKIDKDYEEKLKAAAAAAPSKKKQ
ncbi:Shr3 amino acid permease chaperone [Plectosphaerella plurivora]|uniref:Shr3 amino acid permease chaperone n=1 Tax=Plectosphaerella plurivora TaxID=936078 RepID=A0A9P8VGA3_9PEZI|nr:Shr3 amino acid permease chaperone [Plectosphaerella plurivora]